MKKFKVLDIRGANGSGKSYIARKLMKLTNVKPIYGEPTPGRVIGKVIAYKGEYNGDTTLRPHSRY